MKSKENFNDTYDELIRRRKCLSETIDNLKSGYGLPGQLELDFLNVGLVDLYSTLVLKSAETLIPILQAELSKVEGEIKKL